MRSRTLGRSLIVGAAAVAFLATSAMAADIPVKASADSAPAQVVAYNWSGFYAGANVGYGWGRIKPGTISFYQPASTFVGSISGIDYDIDGVIGGGQVGFNRQFGNMVLGIEADFSGTGMKGSVSDPVNLYTATSRIDWLATARGRIGVAFDRVLAYATGGVAVARVKSTLDDVYATGIVTTTDTDNRVGWTAGGGVEVAVWPDWSVRAEYLYVDLGSKEYSFYEPSPPGWPRISGTSSITANIARAGVNHRF